MLDFNPRERSANTKPLPQCAPTYHGEHGRVDAQRRVLGREGLPRRHDDQRVARAGAALGDVLHGGLAAQRRVVGPAGRQEVGRLVPRHHLAGVGEDGGGEQAEGVDAWGARDEEVETKKKR